MTIKEIENILNVPRTTIRFYEKEGLIVPHREDNGYRDYSDEDVDRLKKIIIFRKIGFTVNDIEGLFDGTKSMDLALDENIKRLQKQIEELTGAMDLCRKMKKDMVNIDLFDTTGYWNYVEEEEQKGHTFIDIAKDFAKIEKKVILSYLGWTDKEGNLYNPKRSIINTVLSILAIGCLYCLLNKEWNLNNFFKGFISILTIIVTESIISIPIFFLGRKFPWIEKNRLAVLFLVLAVLLVILLLLVFILGSAN
ncbi:MAG: MerR family transcriptional regulator [Coprococcus sp.]